MNVSSQSLIDTDVHFFNNLSPFDVFGLNDRYELIRR